MQISKWISLQIMHYTLRAGFTKPGKLVQELNSKMAPMVMEISAGDLLISTNAIYQALHKIA